MIEFVIAKLPLDLDLGADDTIQEKIRWLC